MEAAMEAPGHGVPRASQQWRGSFRPYGYWVARLYRADAVTNRWRFISDEDLEAELAHEAVRERWLWPDDGAGKPTRWRLLSTAAPVDLEKARKWMARLYRWRDSDSEQAGLPTDAPWDLESNLAIQLSDKPMPRSALSLRVYPRQLRAVAAFRDGWITLAEPGELLPYERRFFIPQALPYDFAGVYELSQKAATGAEPSQHPAFDAFLAETFDGGEFGDCVALVWQWLGYLASGSNGLQRCLVCWGPSRSGKGVFARLVMAMFGQSATRMDSARLASPFGTWMLEGRSIAIVDEADPTKLPREKQAAWSEVVNSISGGMPVVMEPKHQQARTVNLQTRFMFVANVPITDPINPEGWSRRALYLPFENQVAPASVDEMLTERLAAEAPHILATALRHYWVERSQQDTSEDFNRQRARVVELQGDEGLPPAMDVPPAFTEPASSRELRRALYSERSGLALFVEARCTLDPAAWTPSRELLAAFNNWAPTVNAPTHRANTFGRELMRTLPGKIHRRRQDDHFGERRTGFTGIKLKPTHSRTGQDGFEV